MKKKGAQENTKAKKMKMKMKKRRTGISGVPRPAVDPGVPDSDWWPIFHRRNCSSSPGLSSDMDEEEWFKHFFRLSKGTFSYICSLVREDLISRPPSGLINIEGRLLSVEKQVAIALRRLASGESQVSVGESFGVGQSTVSQVTWRFIEALEERGRHHLKWPDGKRMQEIKEKFEASCGLPNCCGVIDATHITMTLPAVQTSDDWCDQVNNYSMFMQGVVDDELRFLDIVTGWPGGLTVSKLLKFSGLFRLCESGERLAGNVRALAGGGDAREFIVGGAAYPLLPWLITPYKNDMVKSSTSEFNRVHESVRLFAVKAFSQLKGGWRILNKETNCIQRLHFVITTILATQSSVVGKLILWERSRGITF
ncbi:hypothetical protein MLD38_025068 [Melastoma candidum]|uniref:Uncharacterized protein n=1 Tax=Melastoma candidum TaxID=119954 RepID=A0ACB9NV68_9MYRT|nr:hypothetical protein MLD38_025068 [Melastoma candidum]